MEQDTFGTLIIRMHLLKPQGAKSAVMRGSCVTLARYHLRYSEAAEQYKIWLAANPQIPQDGSVAARFECSVHIGYDD